MAPGHFFFKDRLYLFKETYGSIPGGYLEKIVITTTLVSNLLMFSLISNYFSQISIIRGFDERDLYAVACEKMVDEWWMNDCL